MVRKISSSTLYNSIQPYSTTAQISNMPASKTLKAGDRSISVPTGLFIGNEWVESVAKATFPVENPATGEEIIQIQEGRAEDVDIAVKTARKLFKDPIYRETPPTERAAALFKLADLMEEAKDDLIALEMLDTGKNPLAGV